MNLFNKICIVGVGLIGGSLGMAIKKRGLAKFVVGVARRKSSAIEAVERKAVDRATLDLAEGVRGADLVILCAPVSTIIKQIKQIAPYLKKSALVTDVGSSKVEIEKAARRYLKKNIFVGSHPMAGLAYTGVRHAVPDLFEGAQCFVTSRNGRVNRFWTAVGCEPVFLEARAHDAWVAQFSHLPHALAFTLFQNFHKRSGSLKASNPSLRDLSRISKSDPKLWADILFSNRNEVLGALGRFQKDLSIFAKAIGSRRLSRVIAYIKKANRVSHALSKDF